MRIHMKLLAAVILTVTLGLATTACGGKSDDNAGTDTPTITVGAINDYPPVIFSKSGTLTGYAPELMAALEKAGNFKVKWQTLSFGALITALQANTIDAAISGIDVTPERKKAVDFTEPTFLDHVVLAVPKNSPIKSYEDLKGKQINGTVGSVTYTNAQKLAAKYGGSATGLQTTSANYEAVKSGQAAGMVMNRVSLQYAIDQGTFNLRIVGDNLTTTPAAIAVKKGNSDLIKRFNTALAKIKSTGEYKRLQKKWLGSAA